MSARLIAVMLWGGLVMSISMPMADSIVVAQDQFPKETERSAGARSFRIPPTESSAIAGVFRAQTEAEPAAMRLPSDQSDAAVEGEDGAGDQANDPAAEMSRLITELGSPEFAAREKATAGLRRLGQDALPRLRAAAAEHPDVEVRLRAQDVATGIVNSSVAGRIDSFLNGEEGSFPGWRVFQTILGDGPRIRESFVEIMLRHPEITNSIEVSTNQRMEALQQTITRVQQRQMLESQFPSASDVIAILLCFNDHDLGLTRVQEITMLRILRTSVKSEILRDDQLAPPFRELMAGWISRSREENHPEILWMSMEMGLSSTLPLAIETLKSPNANADTIAIALQLIVRFGDNKSVASVLPLLKDERVTSDVVMLGNVQLQVQIRDLAATTVMALKGLSLDKIGLDPNALHPRMGFDPRQLAFPASNPEPRQKMLDALNELLTEPEDDAKP